MSIFDPGLILMWMCGHTCVSCIRAYIYYTVTWLRPRADCMYVTVNPSVVLSMSCGFIHKQLRVSLSCATEEPIENFQKWFFKYPAGELHARKLRVCDLFWGVPPCIKLLPLLADMVFCVLEHPKSFASAAGGCSQASEKERCIYVKQRGGLKKPPVTVGYLFATVLIRHCDLMSVLEAWSLKLTPSST